MFDPSLHGSEFLRSCWGELRGGGERAMVCVGEAELNIPPQKTIRQKHTCREPARPFSAATSTRAGREERVTARRTADRRE